jgi:hypothetical protein|eukprot:526987-Prymnesium_polylepis.1
MNVNNGIVMGQIEDEQSNHPTHTPVGVSTGFGPSAAQSNHGEVAKWLSALKNMDHEIRRVPIEELRTLAKSGDAKYFTSIIEKYIVTAVKFAAYEIADQNLGKDRTDLPNQVHKRTGR